MAEGVALLIRMWVSGALCVVATAACAVSQTTLCGEPGETPAAACPRLVTTRGAGLVVGQRHVALGWMDEMVLEVADPKDCRLVIVVRGPEDVANVQKVLEASGGDLSRVCTLNAGPNRQTQRTGSQAMMRQGVKQ